MKREVQRRDLSLVSVVDLARLAAFLDGEGSISIAYSVHKDPKFEGARQNYEYVRLTVANTDPRLMQWLVATFGGKLRHRPTNRAKTHKPCYWWVLTCEYATEVLKRALPYFILKRDRAELCIALQATMKRVGRGGTPSEVIAHRTAIKTKLHLLNARGPAAQENVG